MQLEITLDTARDYATEANLRKALARTKLDAYGCRYIVVQKPSNGRYTAIFLVGEYCRGRGGYIGFAADHGFTSI